jgi:hypothetical protein
MKTNNNLHAYKNVQCAERNPQRRRKGKTKVRKKRIAAQKSLLHTRFIAMRRKTKRNQRNKTWEDL